VLGVPKALSFQKFDPAVYEVVHRAVGCWYLALRNSMQTMALLGRASPTVTGGMLITPSGIPTSLFPLGQIQVHTSGHLLKTHDLSSCWTKDRDGLPLIKPNWRGVATTKDLLETLYRHYIGAHFHMSLSYPTYYICLFIYFNQDITTSFSRSAPP